MKCWGSGKILVNGVSKCEVRNKMILIEQLNGGIMKLREELV